MRAIMEPKTEKMALFIDGDHLYATAKSLGFDIDYKRLLREFQSRGYLLRAFYYTAVIEGPEYSSIRPFGASSKAAWISSSPWMRWRSQARSITWCCSPVTATSAPWSRRCSGAACASPWSPPYRRSRQWSPTSCAGKPTFFSTSSSCSRRSAAIRPSARREKRASRASATRRSFCSVRRRRSGLAPAQPSMTTTISRTERPARPEGSGKPGRDCPLCPRLKRFREEWRRREPDWFNAPVASFGPRSGRLLIVGLAPGLRGANRTGRPFTGDFAGDLLYDTLKHFGFARGNYLASSQDGLTLLDARITNAVRCVPPENKPTPAEIETCRALLKATIAEMENLRAIVTRGRISH